VLCDLLWFSRNKVVHEGLIPDINVLAKSIKKTSLDHATAWRSTSPLAKEFWTPPPAGSFKINFDIAIMEQFSSQATVCKDSKGHIIKTISRINPPCDANYGEALAAQLATSLTMSLKLNNFSLKGDSAMIIAALQTPTLSQDWHIESVIASTLSMLPTPAQWPGS
jgi:hypothetical protein